MSRAGADRRVLDGGTGSRAMAAVLGIMLFLTVLAGALGLGTRAAARALDRQLAGRLTVQLPDPDAQPRLLAALRASPSVAAATPVPAAEIARLLRPWLGDAGEGAIPIPAMVDVDLRDEAAGGAVAALATRAVPGASASAHGQAMAPVRRFLSLLTWLAAALVVLMAAATAASVMLAVRSGLEVHRATIEVMHMLGSTDVQVARLFQRRIALDAGIGGGIGAAAALGVIALVGVQAQAVGSELLGRAALGAGGWLLLLALPVLFALLAVAAARRAVLRDLRRRL
jgi:cell division transport system permease protein